jgi:hypothetical protein
VCLVNSTPLADEALAQLVRSGERQWEDTLARWADDDNVERVGAFGATLYAESWNTDNKEHLNALKHVQKRHMGRHRIYVTGHHSRCEYTLWYIKINKRKGVDEEKDKAFRKRILAALDQRVTRQLQPHDERVDDVREPVDD